MGFCDIEEGKVGLVVGVAEGTQDADSTLSGHLLLGLSKRGESQQNGNCLMQNKMSSAGVDKCEHICMYADMFHWRCVRVHVFVWYNLSRRSSEERSFQI